MSLDRGSKKTRKEFNRELINREFSNLRAITAATIVIAGKYGNRREIVGEEIYVKSESRILNSPVFSGELKTARAGAGLAKAAIESSNNAKVKILEQEI